MTRAAIYCRVSTEEQARNGLSLGDQRATLEQYAKSKGMTIVDIYEDAGISARKPYKKRPAILRLLEDVKQKKVDIVLFTKLDRWFRNVGNYYAVQEILDANGVNWQATQEDYETVTASGRLKVNIMLSVAQDEADRTSERIKFTFGEKRARGESTNGRAPLGYKIVNGRPEIDPEAADAALDMFRTFVATRSALAATKKLRSVWGVTRDVKNVRLLLKNHIYIGEFLDTECPALIPKDVWGQTQAIRASRGPRSPKYGTHTFLFQGLVRCAECGHSMSASMLNPKKKKEYVYYRCHERDFGRCTHNHWVREENLEQWLLDNLVAVAEMQNLNIRRREKPRKTIDTEKIKAKMEKLKDLYLSDLIDRDIYERDYIALKKELEPEEPPQDAPAMVDVSNIKTALSLYGGLDRAGKKEFWNRTIKRIVANNDGDFFVELI